MRIARDPTFDHEEARFGLVHCCEDCGFFVPGTDPGRGAAAGGCAHEWPLDGHRRADNRPGAAALIFCKEFEAC